MEVLTITLDPPDANHEIRHDWHLSDHDGWQPRGVVFRCGDRRWHYEPESGRTPTAVEERNGVVSVNCAHFTMLADLRTGEHRYLAHPVELLL